MYGAMAILSITNGNSSCALGTHQNFVTVKRYFKDTLNYNVTLELLTCPCKKKCMYNTIHSGQHLKQVCAR